VQQGIPKEGELSYSAYPHSAKKRNTPLNTYRQLSQEERYTIAVLHKSRATPSEIGRVIGRHRSTIAREFQRNSKPYDHWYRAEEAQGRAIARRKRERRGSHFTKDQWRIILVLIRNKYSPEQVCDFVKTHCGFTISHETIYQYVLYDKKKGGSVYKNLRIMPKQRRKRYNSHDSRGILPGKRLITMRPSNIETRKELGHWEGDTVIGSDKHHCIVTLVERKSGFVIIRKIRARNSLEVTAACIAAIMLHKRKFISITFDNGTEFHDYKTIEFRTGVTCYFALPYHSWERGTNENTNGLIRQYIPKKSCMKKLTQSDCAWIAYQLNTRPRKRHGFKSPWEIYYGKVPLLHFDLEPRLRDLIIALKLAYLLAINLYI